MSNTLKVVICVLNSKYVHSSLAPWYLTAALEEHCGSSVQAAVIEGTINEKMEAVAERIVQQKPQVVGFSCYIWNITATKHLMRLVKNRLPEVNVILGGPEVSYNAEDILQAEALVDFIVCGEGEKPFALLLDAISQKGDVKNIPGLCYRQGEQIIVNAPYISAEDPPNPYTNQYFEALAGRIAYLETSRGCPYSCAFCLSGRCGSVHFFDLEESKKKLLLLANSGTKTIKLVDRTFNANRKRTRELFRFIIQEYGSKIPDGVCFHFEIAGDLLEQETIDLLSKAPPGLIQFEIGMQSFNAKTLVAVSRKTDVNLLKSNIRSIIALRNIHVHLDLIAGLPYEDLESFQESFNTAYLLQPHALQLGFLKILFGTPMREDPERYPSMYKLQPPYEVTATPWLSSAELTLLHYTEDALNRLYNSGRFRRTLQYVIKQTGATPFELFIKFGEFTARIGVKNISLDDYTAIVFQYFSKQSGVDQSVLRDVMVCDRLATNASGKLPPALRVYDPSQKKIIKQLEGKAFPPPPAGIRRGYALLYSEPCLVYVDYEHKNPVSGEYPLCFYKLTAVDN
ncbi:MAG: DUF4080 domain-containing protein [Clostridia bacterium]|nr:DUF4080 domain-containing protein [Clostridia bacterium]